MECGNLYINRTITGARVGIEPFGGFKLSGTGPKAGSRAYLDAFHVVPIEGPLLTNLTRSGTEDPLQESNEVFLSHPGKLDDETRLPRIERGVELIIRQFEYLYQGIYGERKEQLVQYKEFLKKELIDFKQGKHLNVTIPGQMSYNNFGLNVDRVLLVSYEPRAYFSSLLAMISALAVGAGVTIVCRRSEGFFWWSKVVEQFIKSGISAEQLRVQQIGEEALRKTIQSHELTSIVLDGGVEHFEEVSREIYNNQYSEREMIKIITPHDCPQVNDYEAYLELFSYTRSFAINTMRHGAPLELDI